MQRHRQRPYLRKERRLKAREQYSECETGILKTENWLNMVRTIYQSQLNENSNFNRETNNAWLHNFTWGDLNENNNFKVWKLIIHGYKKLHGGDLNENENHKQRYTEILFS